MQNLSIDSVQELTADQARSIDGGSLPFIVTAIVMVVTITAPVVEQIVN